MKKDSWFIIMAFIRLLPTWFGKLVEIAMCLDVILDELIRKD